VGVKTAILMWLPCFPKLLQNIQLFILSSIISWKWDTHLECDSDHACIERAKRNTVIEIRVSQYWHLFVQSVRAKSALEFVEMKREDFIFCFLSEMSNEEDYGLCEAKV
jgi:hypothetical protein